MCVSKMFGTKSPIFVSPMASRWIIITEPVEPFRDPLIAALAFPLLIPFVSGKCDVAQLVWNVFCRRDLDEQRPCRRAQSTTFPPR